MAARTDPALHVVPSVQGHGVQEVPNKSNTYMETVVAAPHLHTSHCYLTEPPSPSGEEGTVTIPFTSEETEAREGEVTHGSQTA